MRQRSHFVTFGVSIFLASSLMSIARAQHSQHLPSPQPSTPPSTTQQSQPSEYLQPQPTPATQPEPSSEEETSRYLQPSPQPSATHPAHPSPHPATDQAHAGHGKQLAHGGEMMGLLGPYPMSREASGTSWQPEATPMSGKHFTRGDWSLMAHGFANVVYDHQPGPRGDDDVFAASMGMLMGHRMLGEGTFGWRAMVSLDPVLVGKKGYPLLLQTGETADGLTPLIDRQHPHDLFMELAVSYSRPLAANSAWFVYFGLPGEPALGPPAFMHRFSGVDNPEAPLGHHWLDSTHITFGVLTGGFVHGDWKIEASVFNGREPDQDRYDIELHSLDSTAVRVSYNPTPNWALQVSRGRLNEPEQLEPGVDIDRTTASVAYHHVIADGHWQTMLAWGRNKKMPGLTTDAWLLESAVQLAPTWTLFGRFESGEKDELFAEDSPRHGQMFQVDKLSIGAVRDFSATRFGTFGVGAVISQHVLPADLNEVYGSDPLSTMVFLRWKLEDATQHRPEVPPSNMAGPGKHH